MNRFVPGNRVDAAAQRGRVFSRRWSRRSTRAEREVWLETYIYADDDAGRDRSPPR